MLVKLVRRIANKIRHCRYKKIKIKGKNNILQMPEWSTKVFIYGNNNKVVIADTAQFKGEICIGAPDCYTDNCTVSIGENTQSNGTAIRLLEDNSTVDIGDDCLFSTNINIACSDTHSILDFDDNLLNIGKSVNIGNRVWLCQDVKISKNVTIPDGCVVGMGSIVTKSFSEPNCIIAGSPAHVVKRKVKWSKLRPKQYMNLKNEGEYNG